MFGRLKRRLLNVRTWRYLAKTSVWSPSIVQLDNATPILPKSKKSTIHGTLGMDCLCGFTSRSLDATKLFLVAV